eukprot:scaffold86_cov338-Pavlova_lutheri.AAC.19
MAPCLRFLACSNGTVWFHFVPFRLGRVEGTPASSFGFVRPCLWCCCGWVSPSLSSPLSSTSFRAGIVSDPTIRFAAGSLLKREVRCANGRDGRRRSSHVWWWQVATMSDVRPPILVGEGRKTLPQLTGGKGGIEREGGGRDQRGAETARPGKRRGNGIPTRKGKEDTTNAKERGVEIPRGWHPGVLWGAPRGTKQGGR